MSAPPPPVPLADLHRHLDGSIPGMTEEKLLRAVEHGHEAAFTRA